jgi:hypothetical protein
MEDDMASGNRFLIGGWSVFLAILLFGLCAIFPSPASAQVASARINGTISDTSGAVIPGAQVILTNIATGVKRYTATNRDGNYSFVDITPGRFTIEASRTGFKTQRQAAFPLSVNQTVTYDFTLPLGTETQVVTVQATAAKLQTGSAELGTVVSESEVNNLPLNGRNFTQLLALTPGVSTVNTSQNSGGFDTNPVGEYSFPSVGGQTNRSNLFLVDGLNDDSPLFSTYTVAPIVDTIEEFKVDSHNDQAAFGGALGGIVNVVTKSGTNQFHGAAWEFMRNNALDARDPFFSTVTPYAWNQFGADIGGPVIIPHIYNGKNRTFFFGSYEGFRLHTAGYDESLIPTPAEVNGDFSSLVSSSGQPVPIYNPFTTTPCSNNPSLECRTKYPNNVIPTAHLDPRAEKLASSIYPTPNLTGVVGENFYQPIPAVEDYDEYSIRADEQLGPKNSFWWKFSHDTTPDYSLTEFIPGGQNYTDYRAYIVGGSWTHTFGPTTVMELELGRNYGYQATGTEYPGNIATSIMADGGYSDTFDCGFTGGPTHAGCYVPGVGIAGYPGWGESYEANSLADIWEWKGNLSKIVGKHSFSMGADFNQESYVSPADDSSVSFGTEQTSNPETSLGGNAFASFLIGVPESGNERNVEEAEHGGWEDGFYFQDQWRPKSRLTLNIGLRYDLPIFPIYGTGSPTNTNDLIGDLDLNNGTYILAYPAPSCASTGNKPPCIPGGTLPAHTAVTSLSGGRIVHSSEDNIEPRFGFAYQISKNNVIRGSYVRMFDDWAGISQMAQNLEGDWPSTGQLLAENLNTGVPNVGAQNPFSGGSALPAATPFNQVEWYMNPLIQNPYAWQWNFGIQHAFGANTIMTVNYAGASDMRLDEGVYMNTARTPGPGCTGPPDCSRLPYSYVQPTYYDESVGTGDYNAFEFSLNKTSGNLSYIISYTWSKMMDQGSDGWFGADGTQVEDPYDLKNDMSVAGYSLTNDFSGSWVYKLPFGPGQKFQTGNRVLDHLFGAWQLNGILNLSSGIPYTFSAPSEIPNTGNVSERPDYTGEPIGIANQGVAHWFNTAAYQAPAPYTFGTVGRNTGLSDWPHNLDLSLFRSFPITESKSLEFRGEFFNMGNWVVWGAPDSGVTDPDFGVIAKTENTARQIQFALKFIF